MDIETNFIGCLVGIFGISLIFYLSGIESLEKRDITAITCIGWIIYILFEKGGLKWHLHQ